MAHDADAMSDASQTHPAPPTTTPHVRIQVLSQARYLAGTRELIAAVSRRLGFDETACSQIALAVDEALCNIIRHGYDKAQDKPIWLSIWPLIEAPDANPQGIRIIIEDEAKQVDPENIKGRELDDIKPGGLGVYIIRNVMDDVLFEKRPEGGMRLSLIKNLPEDAEVPTPEEAETE